MQYTMHFIGVTTGSSSIRGLFPLWMKELGREGVDLPLNGEPALYREAVARIRHDPQSLGALVTSHKIGVFDAARDLFDYLDPCALRCREVSCISKNGALLEGRAVDPINSARCLDAMLGADYFARTGGEVLCLGAGGAATAIVMQFVDRSRREQRPSRIVIVDRAAGRLEALRVLTTTAESGITFEFHHHDDAQANDLLMKQLPPCSLVINATGMGKDLPGSPLTGGGVFPENGIAWELNYRGELEFYRQALRQRVARQLRVEDGWQYFLHGWTSVIAEVLHQEIGAPEFERLAQIARRPR
jgi:shikimate dehydrogenase